MAVLRSGWLLAAKAVEVRGQRLGDQPGSCSDGSSKRCKSLKEGGDNGSYISSLAVSSSGAGIAIHCLRKPSAQPSRNREHFTQCICRETGLRENREGTAWSSLCHECQSERKYAVATNTSHHKPV